MRPSIEFEIDYNSQQYSIVTYKNEYASLMMLLYDKVVDDDEFGDCKGMGKCGTCLVEILSSDHRLVSLGRNEETTLEKMHIDDQRIRLSCQLMIDERLNGLKIKVV